jgi:ABC-type phosphate transport system permease subunit
MATFTRPLQTPTPSAAPSGARADAVFRGLLIAIAAFMLLVIGAIAVFVFYTGWPSFSANGLAWFGTGDDPLDVQLGNSFLGDPETGEPSTTLNAWPAILGTLLTTGGALLISFPFALLAAIFIAELAPKRLAAILDPIVSVLAATPSVIYGLFAILVLAPRIERNLIPKEQAEELSAVVTLTGANVLLGILVLSLMIAPLMVAIFADALRAVPTKWKEGAIALGCDEWRMTRRVSLRAMGRAVGEAIALSMATGSIGFVPNPLDGYFFFLEPVRTMASSIVDYSEGFESPELKANLFAFGVILLITTATLTIGAKIASRSAERRLGGGQ